MYTIISYDGSWQGLLTVVFEIFDRKIGLYKIVLEGNYQPDAFSDYLNIQTDDARAQRVWHGLTKRLSKSAQQSLFHCYLSEQTGMENIIAEYIKLSFSSAVSIEKAYGYTCVLQLSLINKMVGRESHRMEAFVRFQLTKDEIYFAAVSPDFNVLPLIVKHFKNRYADQRWIIYDLKRHYGIYYDLNEVEEIVMEKLPEFSKIAGSFDDDEIKYQQLWKTYFDSVNIKERKNTKLHLQHVPKRYWKYLTEKS